VRPDDLSGDEGAEHDQVPRPRGGQRQSCKRCYFADINGVADQPVRTAQHQASGLWQHAEAGSEREHRDEQPEATANGDRVTSDQQARSRTATGF
jgi:hypothetical protein